MLTALNGIASHSTFRCSYLVSVDEQPEIPVEDVRCQEECVTWQRQRATPPNQDICCKVYACTCLHPADIP